jgi:hypothetical protein
MPEVSVLIPLFGAHRGREVLAGTCASWLAQDVSIEVIVAMAGSSPPALPADPRVRAVISPDPAVASPGTLRNLAADQAGGRWLYLSDADVQPLGADFLARAWALGKGRPLAQPWMYRVLGTVEGHDDGWWREIARRRCCFVHRDSVTGRLVPYPAERYVSEGGQLYVLPPDELAAARDPGEQRWRAPFHWGGLFLERGLFTAVGGYCQDYVGWGCEDDDLLAKVTAMAPVTTAWHADPALRCLHFEHPRPYATAAYDANQATLASRLARGPAAMITADRQAHEERP